MACLCRNFWSFSNLLFFAIAIGTAMLVYWKMHRASQAAPVVKQKTIFAFLGAPGSGKGTLAKQAVLELGYKQLSTGDLCRDNIKRGTELGKKLEEYTSKGALVPDDIISSMAKEWLDANTKDGSTIILDGYPRTANQAQLLLEMLKNYYPDYKLRVIALKISDAAVIERLGGRLMCSNKECGAIYNSKDFVQPVENPLCKACGSPLIKREDDKEEVIRERLNVYHQTNDPLLELFRNAGFTIEEINVEGCDSKEVFEFFKKMI